MAATEMTSQYQPRQVLKTGGVSLGGVFVIFDSSWLIRKKLSSHGRSSNN